ncbi:exodeoxyribonuclease V subunit alpha [Gordonia sp. L191]|uniref:exodeoxyribonuclease V subunit alpha n=1 Tax=Gordonia sp. L191 TaxID=2982699 RepID=UPI0024C07491|nr:exodeoxyribonuclease V subunit alpha [Gordonia sp. L191]WHU49268.1 exodeoxyribonuclease V subunit alpha [Gordonia sp. L191]
MTHPTPPGTAVPADDPAGPGDRVDDGRRVRGARGLLGDANAAGILDAADVHVANRLVRMCGEPVSEIAEFAAALAVRAVRLGSTCLAVRDLSAIAAGVGHDSAPAVGGAVGSDGPAAMPALPSADELVGGLRSSPLVVGASGGPLRPLVVADTADGPLIYLRKYFQQEQVIRTVLAERAASVLDVSAERVARALDEVFGEGAGLAPRQRLAAALAASRWTSVLTGGPGTGKTYTVARILAVLDRLAPSRLHIAVCAPTGRAVAQLQASLDGMSRGLGSAAVGEPAGGPPVHAVTVHGLLGWRPGSRPRYGRGNRLPHDVVVVDETSMLSVTAMSHLLEAVRPDARLILVGDPHQLASVEAGAVLADLVERPPSGAIPPSGATPSSDADHDSALDAEIMALADQSRITASERPRLADGIVELTRNFRNRDGIATVAAAVNDGDGDRVLELIGSGELADISLVEPDDPAIHRDVVAWVTDLWSAARAGDAPTALQVLDSHRVLCAHRVGRWGVQGWTRQIVEWCAEIPGHPPVTTDLAVPQPGMPILVTANDRQNRVFNGDCGVVIAEAGDPSLTVAFRRSEFSDPMFVPPARLAETMWAYAMTIHRSQGSQFDAVTVVLPPPDSPLLTRELLYTAITRAKSRVRIVGTPETLRAAVGRRVHRASGLRSSPAGQ